MKCEVMNLLLIAGRDCAELTKSTSKALILDKAEKWLFSVMLTIP
jgi:hypothetical protein